MKNAQTGAPVRASRQWTLSSADEPKKKKAVAALTHAIVGFALLALVVVGVATIAAAAHVLLRPRSTDDVVTLVHGPDAAHAANEAADWGNIELARALLGHDDAETTKRFYLEQNRRLQKDAAKRMR